MASRTGSGSTLRERKRDRTRNALIDAAIDLFERNGYDGTTVADIAEAADIGTRTFFSYFASKEELLFPESDARVAAAVTAIANREPGDRPADATRLLAPILDELAARGYSSGDTIGHRFDARASRASAASLPAGADDGSHAGAAHWLRADHDPGAAGLGSSSCRRRARRRPSRARERPGCRRQGDRGRTGRGGRRAD